MHGEKAWQPQDLLLYRKRGLVANGARCCFRLFKLLPHKAPIKKTKNSNSRDAAKEVPEIRAKTFSSRTA